MSQTFTTPNSGDGATVMDDLNANTVTLRSSHSGTSAPTGVVGLVFMHEDQTTSNYDRLEVYGNPDGGGDGFHGILEFSPDNFTGVDGTHQLINWRMENTASPTAAASGTVGWFGLDTSGATNRMTVNRDASTQDVVLHGNSAEYEPTRLPLNEWTVGATPPTATTIGTTPTTDALLMDATAETLRLVVDVPKGMDGATSPILRLKFALNIAEDPNDDINITVDMISVTPGTTDALTKTSTQYTGTTDIGAITAQYSTHFVDVTLTYSDATNPIAAGDQLTLEFHLTNLTTVGAVLFLGATLLTPFGGTILET